MLTIACSSCHKNLSVKESLAGKKVKCPACAAVLTVPVLDAAAGAGGNTGPAASQAPVSSGASCVQIEISTSAPGGTGDVTVALPPRSEDAELTEFLAPAQARDELGRLGKYRILQVLGRGGMGVVYKGEDPLLKRAVAVKAMLPRLAASGAAGQRFLREAQAMAAVEHDNVVRVLEVAEERGIPYLAMEFLKGEPLDVRLQRDEKLRVLDIIRIGKEIAEGLAAAHAHGLIHRDIKPANIWLESRGEKSGISGQKAENGEPLLSECRVKILDFGLARSAEQESGLTQQGAIVGTPAYMAPEQARGEKVDARCDLFSLGVVLYRLCSGKQPFVGPDTISTLMAVSMHAPAPLAQANPELPASLSELAMKLLEKDRDKRPAAAAEVARELQILEKRLQRALEPHEPTATLPSAALKQQPAPASSQTVPAQRRRMLLLAGALLLVVGVAGAALWTAGAFRVQSEHGELVLATDDPDFAFATVKGGGLTLEDRKLRRTYHVKAVPQGNDDYELEVTDAGADLVFKTKTLAVQRGGTVPLKAWFERKGTAGPPVVSQPLEVPATEEQMALVQMLLDKKFIVSVHKDGHYIRVHLDGYARARKQLPTPPYTVVGITTTMLSEQLTDDDIPLLTKLPDLRELRSDRPVQITYERLDLLASGCRRITHLTLGGVRAGDASEKLVPVLAKFANLEDFRVGWCQRGNDLTVAYAETLAGLPNLRSLTLWIMRISANAMAEVARAPKLEKLTIGSMRVTPDPLRPLATAKKLRQLHFRECPMALVELQAIQETLPNCQILVDGMPLATATKAAEP